MLQPRYSRFCNLTKEQMQYVNTIHHIVSDVICVPKEMSKILDHLYLGSFEDALNKTKLSKKGIKYILNVVDKYDIDSETGEEFYGTDFVYHGFTSFDEESYNIFDHFQDSYDFIDTAKRNNSKCLIHCMAGINRSGVIATAYFMLHERCGPITAVDHVFSVRGMLLSNYGFIERLVKFADEHDLLECDKEKIISPYKAKGAQQCIAL